MFISGIDYEQKQTGVIGAGLRKGDALRTGIAYIAASIVIAVAAAVYGMFSHGVHSPFMTYAFAIPLMLGAAPHIAAALSGRAKKGEGIRRILTDDAVCDLQLAVIATLTAGSLLKGVLDIYGTTNRLLIGYPVLAAAITAVFMIKKVSRGRADCSEHI